MKFPRRIPPRPSMVATAALVASVVLAGCASETPATATPSPAPPSAPPTARPATPSPSPTPAPTPRFSNAPDDELAALIPTEAAGANVVVAPFDEVALAPGDIGEAFGSIGARFSSVVVAYVSVPRTTLYAMRVDAPPVTTADLEPYLATAGRYVGIAGLHREPWELGAVGTRLAWVRPEDNATALGTHIYTWASGEFVFLLMGTHQDVDRAIVDGLPGEPAPTPTPVPTPVPSLPSAPTPPASAAPSG